jgi:hypothetical protein
MSSQDANVMGTYGENAPKRSKLDNCSDEDESSSSEEEAPVEDVLQSNKTPLSKLTRDESLERTRLYLSYVSKTHASYLKKIQASLLRNGRIYVDLHHLGEVKELPPYMALFIQPEQSGKVNAFFGPMHNPKHDNWFYHVYNLTTRIASPRWQTAFLNQPNMVNLDSGLDDAITTSDAVKSPDYVHKGHSLNAPDRDNERRGTQIARFHPAQISCSTYYSKGPPPEEKTWETKQEYPSTTDTCLLASLWDSGNEWMAYNHQQPRTILNVDGVNLDHVMLSAQYMSNPCPLHSTSRFEFSKETRCLDLTQDVIVMPTGSGYSGMDLKTWKQLWTHQAICFYDVVYRSRQTMWDACFLAVIPVKDFMAIDLDRGLPTAAWDEASLAKNFTVIDKGTSVPSYPLPNG